MILGVIPARLNSTRFPSKVIFPIKGKPIIEYVYEKALQSKLLNKVIVAVDSEETKNVINCSNVIMTSDKHQSGTDRVAEVANKFDCEVVSGGIWAPTPALDTYVNGITGVVDVVDANHFSLQQTIINISSGNTNGYTPFSTIGYSKYVSNGFATTGLDPSTLIAYFDSDLNTVAPILGF